MSSPAPTILAAVLALTVGVACSFETAYDGTRFQCNATRDCPDGFACVANQCVDAPEADAAPGDGDAGPEPASACGGVGVLAGTFDDGRWGEAWGEVSWSPDGPRLRADFTAGEPVQVQGAYHTLREYYFADGDAVSVSLEGVDAGTVLSGRLIIDTGDRNRNQNYEIGLAGGEMRVQEYDETTEDTTVRYTGAYVPEMHRYWRLGREGDDWVASVSPDGQVWQELVSRPMIDPVPRAVVRVSLYVRAPESLAAAAELVFDNLDGTPARTCSISELTDDFDTAAAQQVWNVYQAGGACQVTQIGGMLRLVADASADECGYQSRLDFDADGGTVAIEAREPGGEDDPPLELALRAGGSGAYRFYAGGTPRTLAAARPEGDVTSVELTEDMRWWRMRHSGTSLSYEVSADGLDWETVAVAGNVTFTEDVDLFIQIQQGTGEVAVDNLNLPPVP